MNDRDGQAALAAAALELIERNRTVHERVDCPRCGRKAGQRCVRASSRGLHAAAGASPLKHSHLERLRADGIMLR